MRTSPRPLSRRRHSPDPQVVRIVRQLALAGIALVVVWPAARGSNAWIGWLPMWLVGMPLVAWWALYGFSISPRLQRWWQARREARRRARPQARRRRRQEEGRGGLSRAA